MRWEKRLLLLGMSVLSTGVYAHDDYSLNTRALLTGDFVYMRRSRIHDHSIVSDPSKKRCNSCDSFSILGTKNVVQSMDYRPGFKVALNLLPSRKWGLEFNYLQLGEFTGEKKRHDLESLTFPFDNSSYTYDYYLADKVKAKYQSRFWDAEGNFWYYLTPRRVDYFSVSTLVGFRYVNLQEHFDLAYIKGGDKSDYKIGTTNHLGGPQVGLNVQVNPTRKWTWDVTLKAGALWTYSMHNVLLRDNNNTTVLRKFNNYKHHVGYLGDAFASLGYQLTSFLNLHFGYEMIYVYGLALAPEQLNKGIQTSSGESVYTKGEIILYGIVMGISIGF